MKYLPFDLSLPPIQHKVNNFWSNLEVENRFPSLSKFSNVLHAKLISEQIECSLRKKHDVWY
jgi:hypothetical protein